MRNIAFAAALVGLCFAVAVDASIFGTPKGSFPFGPLTSRNGGSDCAACTLIVALVEQQMQIKKVNASESMELLCSYLPLGSTLDGLCEFAVELFGGTIESLLNQGESADTVCNAINMCKDTAPVCRLFPTKKGPLERHACRSHRRDSQALRCATRVLDGPEVQRVHHRAGRVQGGGPPSLLRHRRRPFLDGTDAPRHGLARHGTATTTTAPSSPAATRTMPLAITTATTSPVSMRRRA
jgi:hypothetical protein